ncbi:TVP38/TMEM64 family protein [Salinicoccus halitifaciens]|uniref:TVP38/TMEM64 family membrane protein n=1 Tax=Salinicoccus halitifaciens TaxID=1073415 RepID=A0ABV2EEF3_9STAP|nr:VTT domain-containing protein [Salinicoccus halitifaciens]MCD2138661.1 VTT domain-containing protein [Salinicoccus halitifaciens]
MERWIELFTTEEGIRSIFEQFEQFGLLAGFLLVILEAFIPVLPLFAIVILNINSYGFIVGFIMSYSATVTGSFLVFLTVRFLFRNAAQRYIHKRENLEKLLRFVDERGFTFAFIMLALPFTPTSVVNVIAALSNMRSEVYLLILVAAKLIMIGSMALVGYDITEFFNSPVRLAVSLILLALLYFFSKWYQRYLNKKLKK